MIIKTEGNIGNSVNNRKTVLIRLWGGSRSEIIREAWIFGK